MNTSNPPVAIEKGPSVAADLARGALWLIWQAVRLPVFVFLVILEPIFRVVLTAVALLGILMSFFFRFAGASPLFPFWGMLGFSVSCGLILMLYYAAIRLLSR
jgi:hypothetical protein